MKILTLTLGKPARKVSIHKEQIIALDSITDSTTRIYLRGGMFRDVAEPLKTIKKLIQGGRINK